MDKGCLDVVGAISEAHCVIIMTNMQLEQFVKFCQTEKIQQ